MTVTLSELSHDEPSGKLAARLGVFIAWTRTLTGWRSNVVAALCLLLGTLCFIGVFCLSWYERAWKRAVIAALVVLAWWAGSISWLLLLALWLILTART